MKTYLNICLTILISFIFLNSSGQTSINKNKETGATINPVRVKIATVYEIISQTKDTFYFGHDKNMTIKEPDATISNTFKQNNRSLDILFHGGGTLLMTLNLDITKQRNDTIPVYSILDPTTIERLQIIKIYNCNLKGFQVNNYEKVQQYAYHKRLLTKLLDFKNQ